MPDVKANPKRNSSILDIFHAFIPTDMIDLIADESNCYSSSKPSASNLLQRRHDIEWRDATSDEIKVMFGLCILMGVCRSQ